MTPAPPDRVDVGALRHPTESSRFALALVASSLVVAVAVFVLVSLSQTSVIFWTLLAIGLLFFLIWLALQLWRVRLLADGVRVTTETLPLVHDAVEVVRQRLDYHARLDVFVVDRIGLVMTPGSPPITLTSYFGVRVIVAEGSALGDLSNERDRRRLVFLLATYVGALKARHTRWSPFLMALEMSGLPKLVFLFVYPWYRSTVYTGDRIAHACCGDLDVSLQAVYRVLVGKEVAPYLRPDGLVGQALAVRRQPILRLAQLLRPVPHATNRYLDLLSCVAERESTTFDTFRAGLSPARGELDAVLDRLRRRRRMTLAAPIGVVLSAALLAGGVVAGLRFSSDPGQPTPVPVPPPTSAPTQEPGAQPAPDLVQMLVARVPEDLRDTCEAVSPDPAGRYVVAVDCNAAASFGPVTVDYYAYPTTEQMQAAFDDLARGVPEGQCSTGNGRGTWTHDGVERGPLACHVSQAGDVTVLWGDDEAGVLVLAQDSILTIDEVFTWWQGHAALASS